jgi:hypothetical protein
MIQSIRLGRHGGPAARVTMGILRLVMLVVFVRRSFTLCSAVNYFYRDNNMGEEWRRRPAGLAMAMGVVGDDLPRTAEVGNIAQFVNESHIQERLL